ncbi:MAG TPA: mechanosensitive ion channel domain-containing protein [Mucilaginibacter sp.]|jgi:small conductance mechanosensitive channel|nr:mechanosensitive ion channel domain-containing protein [Mucilaginibacter sp.]
MKLEKLYDRGINWLNTHGPDAFVGLLLFFIGLWVIRFLRNRLRARLSRKYAHSSLQPFILSLTITALYIVLILTVLEIIGVHVTIFTTIIGAFSVAAGLALSGTFQNFAGGVLIMLLKPFEVEDYIVAQGQEGKVVSIQIFYTVLLTIDNRTIIIPNGKLFNEVIVNVSRENTRRLDFEIKLSYAADIDKAKKIITGVITSNKAVLTNPAPRVGLIGLDNDSIRFTVNVWLDPSNYLDVKIALMEKVVKDLGAAGIAFPKPGI